MQNLRISKNLFEQLYATRVQLVLQQAKQDIHFFLHRKSKCERKIFDLLFDSSSGHKFSSVHALKIVVVLGTVRGVESLKTCW